MPTKVFIIANESEPTRKLHSKLSQRGFDCLLAPYSARIAEQVLKQSPSVVLLEMDGSPIGSEAWALPQKIRQEMNIPFIALVTKELLDNLNSHLSLDDFVVMPWEPGEVAARIKRVLGQTSNIESNEIIKSGDLIIDVTKCQVSLGNKPITLTFREYQLLKFLASSKGRVFTREALLDKVWGWDYYGGDRTVDVHIRRLRSKIEDRSHSFVETVRNIGYRFKEDVL